MSDSLRDQLLGLGFQLAPGPARPTARKPEPSAPAQRPRRPSAPRTSDRSATPPPHAPQPQPRKPHPGAGQGKPRSREDIDLARAYAIRAQREKDERIEAERQKQEDARKRREAKAQLADLVKDKALNDASADIARHFDYGGKIKRIHVTAAQLKALNSGELGVIQLDGRYLLIDAAVLAQAETIFAPAVALKIDPAAPAADDPYTDPQYQVPDDLVW